MANEEALTLDGVELHDGNPFLLLDLDLTPPKKTLQWVRAATQDGATLVEPPFHELREIKAKVQVKQQATMDLALTAMGTLVDKVELAEQRAAGGESQGLALVYVPAGSTYTYTFYVQAAEVTELPITMADGWLVRAPIFTVTFYCQPAAYGAEVTSSVTTSTLPLVEKTLTGTLGDMAAEGRLIVEDNATQARDHVEWGCDTDTAATIIDSDSFVTTGFAGVQATRTGAYDPNASGNNVVRATLSQSFQDMFSTGDQAHVGTYRVKARVYVNDFDTDFQLASRVGHGPASFGPQVEAGIVGKFTEIDLGTFTSPAALLGTQSWEGRVMARYRGGGSIAADVDALWLVPVTRGYGKARAFPTQPIAPVLSAWDGFAQAAGGLTGELSPGPATPAWATVGGGTDFQNTGSGVTRTASAERLATLPVTLAATATTIDFTLSAAVGGETLVLAVARKTGTTTFGYAGFELNSATTTEVVVGKNPATLNPTHLNRVPFTVSPGITYTLGVVVSPTGWIGAFVNGQFVCGAYDADFVTAGLLDDGQPGFYDDGSGSETHTFDNFAAWVPAIDHVVNSGQTAELRGWGDVCLREDTTGVYYGRPPEYNGSRFFLPTGTARVAVKARRFDVDTLPDEFIADSTKVTVKHRPRWLVIPRSA